MDLVRRHGQDMDPELAQILDKRLPTPLLPNVSTISASRKKLSAGTSRFLSSQVVKGFLKNDRKVVQEDLKIPVRGGSTICGRLYRAETTAPSGLLIVFHGGGYCMGDLDTEEFLCLLLCSRLDVAVLNVGYRLAPEFPFPIGAQDALDATVWAADHASGFNVDLRKGFILGGNSGGAVFAAAICHSWRKEKRDPPITGTYLAIPVFENEVQRGSQDRRLFEKLYQSKRDNANAPLLNQEMTKVFWDLYKPDLASPWYTPFLFDKFDGLPPTYFQACGLDPFRDGCLIYERLLREVGVPTRIDLYPGLPHGFWAAYPALSATGRWVKDSLDGISWLLKQRQQVEGNNKL